jgi:hypothetical protein
MCRGGQLGVPHYAQDPAFLGTRGLRLPGHSFNIESPPGQPKKLPYDKVPGIIIEFPGTLVDSPGILIYVLLY